MTSKVRFGARSTAANVLAGIDLTGKRVVLTGCSSGIGKELMAALAANGAQVIGISRSLAAAQEACREVAYNCIPAACDLTDLESVAALVSSLRAMPGSIDVIVANAATAYLPSLHTRYGVDVQLLANHIGHFALINGLSDRLKDAAARIVIVSSGAALHAPSPGIMFDNLAGQRFYDPVTFYRQSKVANALFAMELARRLQPRGIVVNAVDPGATRGTNIGRHLSWWRRSWRALTAPIMKSAAQGAATAAFLAANPAAAGSSGGYWKDCRPGQGNPLMHDEALGAQLWSLSEQIVAARESVATPADVTSKLTHQAA
jgi:WW domain-containing oxidoreductase